jgi:hypothetical protein
VFGDCDIYPICCRLDLGGSPTCYRSYPATAAAPHAIYVWDENGRIVLLRLHDVAASWLSRVEIRRTPAF